jgi:hypothetical protein
MDSPTPEPPDVAEPDDLEHLEDADDVLLAREALEDSAPSLSWNEVKTRLRL